jgi:hypothetical protein
VIEEAAHRWKIPVWALLGVKLMETGSGGAGTANPFQIEPGTASSLGVRDVNNFAESANGAAKLLAQYRRKFRSWSAAFEAYNGGEGAVGGGYAYNQSDVESKLHEFGVRAKGGRSFVSLQSDLEKFGEGELEIPQKLFGGEVPSLGKLGEGAEALGGAVSGPIESLGTDLANVGKFFALLLSGEFWIRAGEIAAGAILLYMGLKNLTGVGVSELPGAKAAKVLA